MSFKHSVLRMLFVFAVTIPHTFSADFSFDEYQFDWIVYNKGDTKFSLIKTEETTFVRVNSTFMHADFTPEEAMAIATELKRTDELWQEMKGSPTDDKKEVRIKDASVAYVWSTKEGFSVKLSQRKIFGLSTISRANAKAFARIFIDAEEMAQFINSHVDF
ncbi:MAG: hypothetical protein LUE17_11985 [Planctomycetaceae bacterium]|nr:hypothetical protein [Planctomycetaceae bacterium]